MNKIMGREYDYIRGNTAVNPNRKYEDFNNDQKKKEIERAAKEKRRKLRALRDKKTKDIIHVSLVICALGVITIMRDGNVYETQKRLIEIKTEVKNVEADNEALRVDLLKFSSLENVKSTAEEIGMKNPSNSEYITVDMSKNYFPELTKDDTKKVEKKSFFSNLMDALKK